MNGQWVSRVGTSTESVRFALGLMLVALTVVAPVAAQECVEPPDNMIAWWPFDECEDPADCDDPIDPANDPAEDIVGDNDATYVGDVGLVGGRVGGGILVDDGFVTVPHNDTLNFGDESDWTIEFWAKGNGVWARKFDDDTGTGYEIVNEVFGNFLIIRLNSEEILCGFGAYPSADWVHVGVTVNRNAPTTDQTIVKCYADGVEVGSETISFDESVDNDAPLEIGPGAVGVIDEVSLYTEDLNPARFAEIFAAGWFGKCKEGGYAPWDKPFCFQDNETEVSMMVCNYGTETQSYDIAQLEPLPTSFHSQCNVDGPTGFTVLTPGPIDIAPSSCGEFVVRIDRPNYTDTNQGSCYQVTFANMDTGETLEHAGSVWATDDQCANVGNAPPLIDLQPEAVERVIFEVQDTGRGTNAPFAIRVVRSDMAEVPIPVSLNGGEAGAPIRGTLSIPRRGRVQLPVALQATGLDPFQTYDVILVLGDEKGREVVLQSTGLRTVSSGAKLPDDVDTPKKSQRN